MKAPTCIFTVALAAAASAASPTLTDVGVVQSGGRTVTISYKLAHEPAVVTVDIQTNAVPENPEGWASIGGESVCPTLSGDVSRVVGCGDDVHTDRKSVV